MEGKREEDLMIYRTFDKEALTKDMLPYVEETKGFVPREWLSNEKNIALTDGDGNYALFEYGFKGVYIGHYFLLARGRVAINLCKEFLKEIFKPEYGVEVLKGLTPVTKLGALWMNRQLGFNLEGITNTISGPCQMVSLTRKEWEERWAE